MARAPKTDRKSTGASDANFGNAETIPENPVYVANFDGDEINGKIYKVGDRIDSNVDAGTIRYLVQIGRITESTTADSPVPATGGSGNMTPQGEPIDHAPADPLAGVTLTDDEVAARDQLVADEGGNLDRLREIAANDGVEGVTADQDAATVATLIVVKRRA